MPKYQAKVIGDIDNGQGHWKSQKIGVFCEGNQIGEYERNYSSFMNTFTPFICNGQELALYSRDYTATRIMEIPSCKDLGGEEQHGAGFCPTDFFVPYYRYVEQYSKAKIDGKELGTFDFHLYGPEALDKEEWAMMIG